MRAIVILFTVFVVFGAIATALPASACSALGQPCKIWHAEIYNQCNQGGDCGCACKPDDETSSSSSSYNGHCVQNNNSTAGTQTSPTNLCPLAPEGQVVRTNLFNGCCEYTFGVAPSPAPTSTYSYSAAPQSSDCIRVGGGVAVVLILVGATLLAVSK